VVGKKGLQEGVGVVVGKELQGQKENGVEIDCLGGNQDCVSAWMVSASPAV